MPQTGDRPLFFVSHSHGDHRLATRLHALLDHASGNAFDIRRSSEEGAIKTGQNWREWIDDSVLHCDVALVLLTPGSLRGRWVMWEAGAVAGVQYERDKDRPAGADDPAARRVRVLRFGIDNADLGPFAGNQTGNGLDAENMGSLVLELLADFRDRLPPRIYEQTLMNLREMCRGFVDGAREDLRHSPVAADEGLIQAWVERLDRALERAEYDWVVAAARWINIAFLGAGRAEALEPIDFRLHTRIAEGHRHGGDFASMARQLTLAEQLSPNDILILRSLGEAYRKSDAAQLPPLLARMEGLDANVFRSDREAIALKCGYLVGLEAYPDAEALLAGAEPALVNGDGYLLGWRALATLYARGPDAARPVFVQLERLMGEVEGRGFYDTAAMLNALLALGKHAEAEVELRRLGAFGRTGEDIRTATAHFDRIVESCGSGFDWRAILRRGIPA